MLYCMILKVAHQGGHTEPITVNLLYHGIILAWHKHKTDIEFRFSLLSQKSSDNLTYLTVAGNLCDLTYGIVNRY